jgi:hypothetical protein
MEIIALITAIAKLIPVIGGWIEKFIVYYTNASIDRMKSENLKAIRKVLDEKDQRELEKAIGSPSAGLPSHTPGADIVDSLPNVPGPKP